MKTQTTFRQGSEVLQSYLMAARLTARLPEDRSVCQNHRASKHHEIEHVWAFVGRIISLYTRPVSTWSPWKSRNTDHSSQHLNDPPPVIYRSNTCGLPSKSFETIYIYIYTYTMARATLYGLDLRNNPVNRVLGLYI